MRQLHLPTTELWVPTRDGDPDVLALFKRHYSHRGTRDWRKSGLCVGPGEKLVLKSPRCDAIWAWRLERYRLDQQDGLNCAVFRNESPVKSSAMVLDAMRWAGDMWPAVERYFTFVDGREVRSTNPGWCFQCAGWVPEGYTKDRRLRILAYYCAGASQ